MKIIFRIIKIDLVYGLDKNLPRYIECSAKHEQIILRLSIIVSQIMFFIHHDSLEAF